MLQAFLHSHSYLEIRLFPFGAKSMIGTRQSHSVTGSQQELQVRLGDEEGEEVVFAAAAQVPGHRSRVHRNTRVVRQRKLSGTVWQ